MNQKAIPVFYLIFLILGSLAVRVLFLQDFSLSNDELSALNRLQFDSLKHLFSYGILPDGHPAGAQVLLYGWTSLFGNSPLSVRLPFLLLSNLAPVFAYLLAKRSANLYAAILFSSLIAFLPFTVLYGMLARPYGIGLSLILAAAWLWHSILFKTQEEQQAHWRWITLGLLWSLSAYFHYFAALSAAVMALSGLLFIKRSTRLHYLLAMLLAVVIFLPHLGITWHQLGHGGVGSWLSKPTSHWIWEHLFHFFNESQILLYALGVILLLLGGEIKKWEWKRVPLFLVYFAWFLLPFLAGYIYSIQVDAVLQHSVLIFSTPFLVLALLYFLPIRENSFNLISSFLFTTLLLAMLLYIKPLKPNRHFADFESVANDMMEWQEAHPRMGSFCPGKPSLLSTIFSAWFD
jgi:uncharacterized membrane protein